MLLPNRAGASHPGPGRRGAALSWAVGAGLGLLLAALLYLPQARGLAAYYRHPYPPTMTYGRFLDALPRHALTGERLPRPIIDPLMPQVRMPDPPGSAVYWALPVLALVIGSTLGWSRYPDARPLLASLAAVTVLGVLLPLAVPAATEVRFDTWAAPWFCVAVVLLLSAAADTRTVFGRSTAVLGFLVLVTQLAVWDARWLPNQPIREAMRLANALAPRGRPIVIAYLGATEATFCYAADAPDHAVVPAPDTETVRTALALLERRTGRLPWLVIPFEGLAHDREPITPAGRDVWRYVTDHYRPVARLPGRLSSVAIYAPVGQVPMTKTQNPINDPMTKAQ